MPSTRILAFLLIAFAAQAQTAKVWEARLADKQHSRMSVTLNGGQLEISADQVGPLFDFPPSSLTEVLYSTSTNRRSTDAYNYFGHMSNGNDLLPMLAMALTAPFGSGKKHIVNIRWLVENGHEAAIDLEFGKDDYKGFLDWLQRLSGKQWVDLDEETSEAESYISEHAGSAFRVRIKDPMAGGSSDYYVLPFESSRKTQLYFFQGAVRPRDISGILFATTEYHDNRCVDSPQALYGNCHGNECELMAIVLPAVTFRITAEPGKPPQKIASQTDCDSLREQQANWEKKQAQQE